jgi:PAS domain-containing protein
MKDTGEGFLGYTPGDLFWMDVLEIVHPDDLPRLRALLSEVKESPGTSLSVEVRFRDVSGRWHQMDASVQNVLEAPGDAGLVAVDVREAHTG